jgi:hypothetical protein
MAAPVATTAPARPALSARNKTGMILVILLGLTELPALFRLGSYKPGAAGPPAWLAIAGAMLGLVTIIAAIYMWVSHNRVGGRIAAGALILSILPTVPTLFLAGAPIPAPVVVALAALVVVAIVAMMLVLAPPKPTT